MNSVSCAPGMQCPSEHRCTHTYPHTHVLVDNLFEGFQTRSETRTSGSIGKMSHKQGKTIPGTDFWGAESEDAGSCGSLRAEVRRRQS